jgi:long-chain acyl-CoA synthetase
MAEVSGSPRATRVKGGREPPAAHPWLKSYPKGVDWQQSFEPKLLGAMLDSAVSAHGPRPCIYFMGKRTTYRELGALSDRVARGLQSLGVGPGVKVGLFLPNAPTVPVFYYGVLKAGGTVVNFNPLYSLDEIEFQIRDSETEIMVTLDLELTFDKIEAMLQRGLLRHAVVASFASQLPQLKALGLKLARGPRLATPEKSSERTRIVLESEVTANDGHYRRPDITPDAVAVLQYTGGTTGTPKAAMLTHANVSINAAQVTAWMNRKPKENDRVLGILPLFHVFAMTGVMNLGITQGMEIILVPKFDLIDTLKLIQKLRPTVMPGVPTLFNAIMRYPNIRNFDISSLEFCLSGGAPLPIEVKRGFEALAGCHLVEGYGLSETSPVATCNPLDREPKEGSIGLPLPGTEISIRSLEDASVEMPTSEVGEVCIAGPQVMPGYWNKKAETEASFSGRFFRTGDVGYMDEEGFVFIVDRIKDMIIASGFKVYPRRIEEALYEHPAIAEVTVIGVPDTYRGEAPKAFVRLKEGALATERELLDFLGAKLSKIELPAEIEFRDELPKTMVGKLSKKELRAAHGASSKNPSRS